MITQILDSPALCGLFLISGAAFFLLYSQLADLICHGRLFAYHYFSGNWQNWSRFFIISAPLLGLLGTVSGLRKAFAALNMNNEELAAGLSEALVTTKIGLFLAVAILFMQFILFSIKRHRNEK